MTERKADSFLDPWCVVYVDGGDKHLFGYAHYHPTTNGLSWLCSTSLTKLHKAKARAYTKSGRCYKLGREIKLDDIPKEGEEAWLAFDLLVRDRLDDDDIFHQLSGDKNYDGYWLSACKVARSLNLPIPRRVPDEVSAFLAANIEAYHNYQNSRKILRNAD